MRNPMLILAAMAALALAGCSKSATVEGEGHRKLTLVRPAAVTLHRGGMAKTDIRIGRRDLPGEVAIRFSNLPKGVDLVESDSRIVGERGTYTLRAGDAADLVTKHSASVTATGGPGSIAVSEPIDITVLEKE